MTGQVLCRLLAGIALSSCLNAQVLSPKPPVPKPRQVERPGGGSLSFIENRGQFDAAVKFQAKSGGKILWFTSTGIVFDVQRRAVDSRPGTAHEAKPAMFSRGSEFAPPGKFERLVFAEDFANGNASPKIEASVIQPGIYNYFIGNDPKNWRTGVVAYSQLVYHDVWPGIDVRFVAKGADIEQEFLVHPGADTSRIQVAYRGAQGLQVTKDGSMIVQTSFGPLREGTPHIYQEDHGRRTSVHGKYKILGDLTYAFQLGSYSKTHPLVIDPTLLFSTYIGGTGTDAGTGVAVDAGGNTYISGYSQGGVYPTTMGTLQSSCPSSACSSSVVTKLNPLGGLSYSTYLGSTIGGDVARGIAVDANGDAYVVGTGHAAFPTTSNGLQICYNTSAFMAKLNPTGTALLYSTCIGEQDPGAFAIALDVNGRAYVTGQTTNNDFPITSNALQSALAGPANAYVSVIDPSLSGLASLVYSTPLGGGASDLGRAIAVDAYGNAYVTGSTQSTNFPVTPNAFQGTDKQTNYYCGDTSNDLCPTAFVAKVNPNVSGPSGLIYSSYLGGKDGGGEFGDIGYGIAVDPSGNAYVGGTTGSPNFLTTPGAFQPTLGGGFSAGFITKVNPGGSALTYSTFLGSIGARQYNTYLSAIALDSSANAYVVGFTASPTFPVTTNAFQGSYHGGYVYGDAFLTELSASGSNLIYSSYLGGSGDDVAAGVAVDVAGDVYVTGNTDSVNFPITPDAFQPLFSGSGSTTCNTTYGNPCPDVFVSKFPLGSPGGLSIIGILPSAGGNAGTVSPQIVGTGFHAGVTAQLNCGSQSIVGSNVAVGAGGQLLNTTFSLTAASPGACNVVVTNPDGTSATLSQAFAVQLGGTPNIQIYLTGAARRLAGPEYPVPPTNAVYLTTVSNTGNVDFAGGLISNAFNPAFSLTSANPLAIADFATLNSISDVLWLPASLAAGQSQVFSSTATTSAFVSAASSVLGSTACLVLDLGFEAQCIAQEIVDNVDCANCAQRILATCTPPFITTNPGACIIAEFSCFFKNSCELSTQVTYCLQQKEANCRSAVLGFANSSDPNSLQGPPGVGAQDWTSGAQALTYGISFANEPTATAPAQQVVVTQPLGPSVNLSTLNLSDLTIPNGASSVQVTVPPGSFNPTASLDEFTTNVDLRPSQSLLVNVDAKLNPSTQTLTWTFTSIDPTTGLPPLNPLVGFLPPGTGANVAFSVTPTPGVATGSQVSEQATIVFDANPPMNTAAWVNTIDNTPPVSHVSTLPAGSTCPAFRVSWSGSDVGSGLQGFTVYVSDTGSPFTPWLSNTTAASADYIGVVGHTYSFYSIASDLVGNMEGAKTAAEASTSVTSSGPCGAPSLSGQLSNVVQSGTTVTATLTLINIGFTAAQAVNINQITFRTLSGSGTVTLASPAVPAAEGPLAIGASTTVTLTLNVPATVTRFSVTEIGTIQDGAENAYNYSMAQTVIP